MAFLSRIEADGSQGRSWEVSDKPLVVGRGDFADAWVDDDSLSRSHFLIVREHDEFFLVDLHSRNGTWVHGQAISAHTLPAHETIMAGQSLFCFSLTPIAGGVRPIVALLPEISGATLSQRQAA